MKYIFANWKMYLNVEESVHLSEQIARLELSSLYQYAIFPNSLAAYPVKNILQATEIALGAQNVSWTPRGAYTGATSAELYHELGAQYALVGHSERRIVFGEKNEDIRKKVEACFAASMTPILCLGETKEDKDSHTRDIRLSEQLKAVFEHIPAEKQNFFVAYEPVWAISAGGSGEPCTPADLQDVSNFLEQELEEYTDKKVPLLYGGSVNAENVVSYISLESVAGVLVGSASSKIDFWKSLSPQS